MALLDEKQMFGSGIVKELEESAISLVLQNLQQDQYQYPEKSFIREIVSNCVDAIEEKKVAISILTGETTVEDHYSTVESDITRDSKFNPEYYSLDHLSSEDKIEITYVNRYSSNRDRIIIEDVKGSTAVITDVFRLKQKLFEYKYPDYTISIVTSKDIKKFQIETKYTKMC